MGHCNVKGEARVQRDESSQRNPCWSGMKPSMLQVAPKGNSDKMTAQLVNSFPQPCTGPLCHGISFVSSGQRPVWWLASLPCPSLTLKQKVWFFFHCSPLGSYFLAKPPPLLAQFPPKRSCQSSWLLENIWEHGREGAVKEQELSTHWGKLCLAAQGSNVNHCHSTGKLSKSHGGSRSFWPACLSFHVLHAACEARTPAPPALGSSGISDLFFLWFWSMIEDFSWLGFLDFYSYTGLSSFPTQKRQSWWDQRMGIYLIT